MKLTPLNITMAVILVWLLSEWQMEQEMIFSWVWLILLLVVISIVDLGFRLLFKDLKRIWFLEIGFMLIVGIVMVILKIQ